MIGCPLCCAVNLTDYVKFLGESRFRGSNTAIGHFGLGGLYVLNIVIELNCGVRECFCELIVIGIVIGHELCAYR